VAELTMATINRVKIILFHEDGAQVDSITGSYDDFGNVGVVRYINGTYFKYSGLPPVIEDDMLIYSFSETAMLDVGKL
jgi:hypothetical protein